MIAAVAATAPLNPFPGLRPFEPDEDYLFFGRERQVDELLRRLRLTRFLPILGTSGCGKSSLVRSGLVPSLQGGAMTRAGSSWRIAILRPGEDPIGNLASALEATDVLGGSEHADGLQRALLETTLRASNLGLVECVRHARIAPRDNVLVLVDQFEELFRFKQSRRAESRDEAVAFAKLLLEASHAGDTPIYVALTMRSDFIGNCLALPGLPEAINEGLYLVPRMTRDELRAAITGPVAVGGAAISARLVSRLLNDVGDDPDQLPILQHALMRTWDRWLADHPPGEPLDLHHYEAIGTMKEALSRHADEALGDLDARGQTIAEATLKALTVQEPDGHGVRRPATVREISDLAGATEEEVGAAAEPFRRPGRSFLMPPPAAPLHADSVLDISHESLMRIWDRLRRWVEEEARSAQVYIGAARAAARHEVGAAALWRGPELQLALKWRDERRPTAAWASRYDPSFERAMGFLDMSAAERDREVAEREAGRRRALRRAWFLTAVFAAATIGTLALGLYALRQKRAVEVALGQAQREAVRAASAADDALSQKGVAEEQRREAVRQRSEAVRQQGVAGREQAEAQRQAAIAEEERKRAEGKELEARARAAEANAARLETEGQRAKAVEERERAERLRAQAEDSEREAKRLGHLSFARAVALEILRYAGTRARERDVTRGATDQEQVSAGDERSALLALQVFRLNRDNQGQREDPDVFNALRAALGGLRSDSMLRGHDDAVRVVTVGSDGSTFVSGSDDGTLRRFDLRQPAAAPVVIGMFGSGVRALALGAGGLLAAGSAGGEVRVWSQGPGQSAPIALASSGSPVAALAFAPGRPLLAAASGEGTVRLWDLERPEATPVQLDTQGLRVASLTFSPERKTARGDALYRPTLAAGTPSGALLWDLERPTLPPRHVCQKYDVRGLAFYPLGRMLACGDRRGTIGLESLNEDLIGHGSRFLQGHSSSVNALSFSPQGDFLASASSDGTVRLWNPLDPAVQPIVLSGHDSWVWSLAFMPAGDRLVSGGADRTVRVWTVRSELMASEICERVPRALTQDEWSLYMPKDLPYAPDQPCAVLR